MAIENIEYICQLSRLDLPEEEAERLGEQLEEIVSFVEKINELDTSQCQLSAQALELNNAFREDKVHQNASLRNAILDNAPEREDSFIVVPRIIE